MKDYEGSNPDGEPWDPLVAEIRDEIRRAQDEPEMEAVNATAKPRRKMRDGTHRPSLTRRR